METETRINNAFYDTLGKEWYERMDHPVALLRAENAIRLPWISQIILKHYPHAKVLDVGCGAGLLSNPLAKQGLDVTGIDLSENSLTVAKMYDATKTVKYLHADAEKLPFENESFDVVCALDLLEHVENPETVILEAARVLKKDGLFFFHTFNRNFLSYLLIIKGVEWAVQNTPEKMHIYRLFIKPQEMRAFCKNASLDIQEMLGLKPKIFSLSLFKMLIQRKVPENFRFEFSRSLLTGYIGFAKK